MISLFISVTLIFTVLRYPLLFPRVQHTLDSHLLQSRNFVYA
jgi:hypothetical protein